MTKAAAPAALALFAGVSALALSAGAARAQEEGAEQPVLLAPVTVSAAQRDERNLLDTPAAVTVMEQSEIANRQADDFQDLIGDQPGVQIGGGPRAMAQEPNIRGFQDDQIVLRFDGGRFNFNQAHRGRFFIDPSIVQRIEIVRGGGSTLHGSGALGGVIAVETKDAADLLDPGETWGGRLQVGYASNGQAIRSGATLFGAAGDWDMLAFAGFRDMRDDLKDGDGSVIRRSQTDVINGLAKIGWEPSAADRVEFSVSRYEDEAVTPPNANTAGSAETDVARTAGLTTARLSWDHSPADSSLLDLSTLLYWNGLEIEEDRTSDGRLDRTNYDTFGFEATNRSRFDFGLPVGFVYGVEVVHDSQSGTRDGAARAQFPDATALTLSAFVEGTIEAGEMLEITPGIRVDRYSRDPDGAYDNVEETFVSPRLGLSFRPVPAVQLWANLGRAFRAPSLSELYNDGTHFEVDGFGLGPGTQFSGINRFVPNPDLEPEETIQLDIGLRIEEQDLLRPQDRLTFSANAYYADATNFIDQVVSFIDFSTSTFDPVSGALVVDGTTTTSNVDAILWGAELEAKYDAQDWFLGASVTIPRGESDDGSALGSIPQDRFTLSGGLRPRADLELGARVTHALDKDDVPSGVSPAEAWTTLDIYAAWTPTEGPFAGVELRAGVDNVFDASFRQYPSELNEAGRTFKLSGALRF